MPSLAELEAVAGIAIPAEVQRCTPTGDKLIVLIEVPPALAGSIVVPETTRQRGQGGSGWIIALGPDAGPGLEAAAGAPREELLGRHICWGRYAGEALVTSYRDDEFNSRFRIIREEHVMCFLDTNPNE